MKKRIFALALALCMMLSAMPTSFAGNGFLTDDSKAAPQSGILTDDSKTVSQSGVLTGASKYYRQDGILYNTGSQSGASYSLPSGITPLADPVDDPVVIDTVTYSGTNTANGYKGGGDTAAPSSRKDVDGLFTSKTVSKKNDSTYTVELQAYSTGTTVYAPADIVLVLDESAGMTTSATEYVKVYGTDDQLLHGTAKDENGDATVDKEGNPITDFYIVQNGNYVKVKYCDASHALSGSGWATGDGWYTGGHFWNIFHWGNRYLPMRKVGDTKYKVTWGLFGSFSFEADPEQFYMAKEVENTTKLSALKTAAKRFVDDVYNLALSKNADYKVSVIGFKDDVDQPENETVAQKIQLTSVNTTANVNAVKSAIDSLSTEKTVDATGNKKAVGVDLPTALGLADTQLKAQPDRQKVIVVFSSMDSVSRANADAAIAAAKEVKANAKVKVFAVGMMDIADPTLDVTDSKIDWDKVQSDENGATILVNTRLQGVSSNFPSATACKSLGTKAEGGNYYKKATNQDQISSILTTIQNQLTTSSTTLDANAKIIDTVSKYFNAPAVSGVTVQTMNCASYTEATEHTDAVVTWDETSLTTLTNAASVSNNTVTVTGFDFNKYCITANAKNATPEAPHGRKVIITFDVTVKTGFMGGNNVPTNTGDSGITTADDTVVEHFTYPLVNVTIPKPVVEVEDDQVIYYGETAPAVSDLYTKITPTETDAWKYDFVELTYTVPNGINNDACGPYDFQLNIKPIAAATTSVGTANATTGVDSDVAQVKVHVLKAVLEGKDDTIYLGSSTDLNDLVSHSWACDCDGQVPPDDTATGPAVDYVFAGDNSIASTIEGAYAPADNDCEEITVTCNRGNGADTFTVHVIRPTITFNDIEIYLSQTPVYNPQFAWDTTCQGNHSDIPVITGTAPTVGYVYIPVANAFTNCTDVNVTVKLNNEDYTSTVTLKNGDGTVRGAEKAEFKVHVFLPQIALESQDLWADYDCDVDLNKGIKSITITGWADQCGTKENKQHTGALPQCSDPVYQFERNGEKITGYNAKNVQVTDYSTINVALDSVKIGATNYAASVLPAVTPVEYKIHVNKFDLTIKKTWNGADVYKQDAIFTVSGGLGKFQVVLPAGQESITVKNLLCGQKYEVTEDSGWTWRWNSSSEKPVLEKTDTAHTSVSVRNPHDQTDDGINPGAHGAKSVYFTNSLINRLWFSFCTFLSNIFGRRGN